MSAESPNKSANRSANQSANEPATKKRALEATQKKASRFSFPNYKVAVNRYRPRHNFSAVSNEYIKRYYGSVGTPKGGKRSGKRSGQKTRRHRSLRSRSL
jgi:hypothetical protein